MNKAVAWANAAGVIAALGLSLLSGVRPSVSAPTQPDGARATSAEFPVRETPGGRQMLDKSGVWVPLLDYRRIASGSTIADELLLRFSEPDRIVSFTQYSQSNPNSAHRYAGKPLLRALDDLETLLMLKPDLVVLNTLGTEPSIQRLRDAKINVFDLGEMRGVETFKSNALAIATLVGRPELGRAYAEQFQRRLDRIAQDVAPEQAPTGAYFSVFGTQVHSGGAGTSYDDLLSYAGLRNIVAKYKTGWPSVSSEEALAWDPEYIVTMTGMREPLCRLAGFERLSACARAEQRVVELPSVLLSDPGSAMLDAAEQIHAAVQRKKGAASP